jgi:hypothetical protein
MAPLNADSIDFQITSPSPLHLLRRNVLELTELSEWDTRERHDSKPSKPPSLPNLQAFQIAKSRRIATRCPLTTVVLVEQLQHARSLETYRAVEAIVPPRNPFRTSAASNCAPNRRLLVIRRAFGNPSHRALAPWLAVNDTSEHPSAVRTQQMPRLGDTNPMG